MQANFSFFHAFCSGQFTFAAIFPIKVIAVQLRSTTRMNLQLLQMMADSSVTG